VHAEGASLRSAPRTPAWWPGPARVAPSPPGPPPGEPDASLSCVAPGRRPGAPRGRAARPACAGSGAPPHAPTPRALSCRRPARSNAGPGRTRCTAETAVGTPADRTPPTAATPRAASARADFWRHALDCATPASPARPSRTPGRAPRRALQVPLGGLPFFQDARDRGLHRRTPHPSTFRLHAPGRCQPRN
jgi:hypothetical protein